MDDPGAIRPDRPSLHRSMNSRDPSPFVFIVIVNWNGLADTLECLESLRHLDYPNFEILLVDNASADNSVETIRDKYPSVRILANSRNLGFTGGNNIGIRHALENGAAYVWLLNNDTIVDPHALSRLVEAAERDRGIGILGSKIYYASEPDVISFAGASIDWNRGTSSHIGRGEVDRGQYDKLSEVERVSGCSMLVKKEVCDKVGLFDEAFFLFVEDVDWCVRAKRSGFRCVFVPSSVVWHKEGSSIRKAEQGSLFSYYNTRNFLLLIKKTFTFPEREKLLFHLICDKMRHRKRTAVKSLFSGINPPRGINRSEYAVVCGVRDFLLNRLGKSERL
jgi:GT2 family glycosyltransferase